MRTKAILSGCLDILDEIALGLGEIDIGLDSGRKQSDYNLTFLNRITTVEEIIYLGTQTSAHGFLLLTTINSNDF